MSRSAGVTAPIVGFGGYISLPQYRVAWCLGVALMCLAVTVWRLTDITYQLTRPSIKVRFEPDLEPYCHIESTPNGPYTRIDTWLRIGLYNEGLRTLEGVRVVFRDAIGKAILPDTPLSVQGGKGVGEFRIHQHSERQVDLFVEEHDDLLTVVRPVYAASWTDPTYRREVEEIPCEFALQLQGTNIATQELGCRLGRKDGNIALAILSDAHADDDVNFEQYLLREPSSRLLSAVRRLAELSLRAVGFN